MRANYKMQRLFIDAPLGAGARAAADPAQAHYLARVMRMGNGDAVLLFNGRDGEWQARLAVQSKKQLVFEIENQTRPQPEPSDLVYCFAPLKQARLDYMVQKAVEMGAGLLQPVVTRHTQNHRLSARRLAGNAVEAAEQCGILSIPAIGDPLSLADLLAGWEPDRRLIFCDESHDSQNPLTVLCTLSEKRLAVLIGPEGGFADEERQQLHARSFVTAIPLGPRILRADTAAVAALAVVQAAIGDWR